MLEVDGSGIALLEAIALALLELIALALDSWLGVLLGTPPELSGEVPLLAGPLPLGTELALGAVFVALVVVVPAGVEALGLELGLTLGLALVADDAEGVTEGLLLAPTPGPGDSGALGEQAPSSAAAAPVRQSARALASMRGQNKFESKPFQATFKYFLEGSCCSTLARR